MMLQFGYKVEAHSFQVGVFGERSQGDGVVSVVIKIKLNAGRGASNEIASILRDAKLRRLSRDKEIVRVTVESERISALRASSSG